MATVRPGGRGMKRFNIFVPTDVYDSIKRLAENEDRSMRSMIVRLLTEATEHERNTQEEVVNIHVPSLPDTMHRWHAFFSAMTEGK